MTTVKHVIGKGCLAVILAFAGYTDVRAEPKFQDFYFQQHQRRFGVDGQDGRILGMAGSTALVTRNSISAATNPAGLGFMKLGDVSASYGYNEVSGNAFPNGDRVKDKQNMGQVYGAVPLGPVQNALPDYGNLALGWRGEMGDWKGDPQNTDSQAHQVTGAYGAAIGQSASLGYSLTYLNDKVELVDYDYDATESFVHRLGVQYQDTEDLILGGVATFAHGSHDLSNFQVGALDQTVDHFRFGLGFGGEYTVNATAIGFGVDYNYYDNKGTNRLINDTVWGGDAVGHAMNLRLGIEQMLGEWFAVRAGYRYAANFSWDYKRPDLDPIDGGAKYNAISLGAGLKMPFDDGSIVEELRIDYGVEYRAVGRDDWQHIVSLIAPFDICI